MKTAKLILGIVAALAAIAGIIYVVVTYGDKIVAWTKKLFHGKCKRKYESDFDYEGECYSDCEVPASDSEFTN